MAARPQNPYLVKLKPHLLKHNPCSPDGIQLFIIIITIIIIILFVFFTDWVFLEMRACRGMYRGFVPFSWLHTTPHPSGDGYLCLSHP